MVVVVVFFLCFQYVTGTWLLDIMASRAPFIGVGEGAG